MPVITVEAAKLPKELLKENELDNVGVSDVLLSDKKR